MQKIGEQLEKARKQKGISLREAAEATKMRSDFLSDIEQNHFDFELPEIYKRGFVKNYARYLKLDSDKIVTDFDAQRLGGERHKKGGAEWFGAMDIPSPEKKDANESATYGSIKTKPINPTDKASFTDEPTKESDKIFYLKAGLVFIVGALLVFGLIRILFVSSIEKTSDAEPQDNARAISPDDEFKLIASGNVFVAVRQLSDRKMLYQGTLTAGENISLRKKGSVEIVFTVAENITIGFNGEIIRPQATNSSGSSKIRLP